MTLTSEIIHILQYLKDLLSFESHTFCQMDQLRGPVNMLLWLSTKHNRNSRFGDCSVTSKSRFFQAQTNSQVIKIFDYFSQVSRENLQNYLEFVYKQESVLQCISSK